ncbi:MAG TPA: hypothetical protein VIW46_11735 [Acidimicrobiia bacterium]
MKTIRHRWLALVVLLVLVTAACSDDGALEEAQGQVADLQAQVAALEAESSTLEGQVADLESQTTDLQATADAAEAEAATLEATLASTAQDLILQADIVGDGCMLQNAYLNDGERKATFRVRVYDPATGEPMGVDELESVTVTLGDGQVFELAWGPHPPNTEDDFFWTYGWEIFAGYPVGNVSYTIEAVALDGRTGAFDPFLVAPSLLTILDAAAAA